MEVKLKSKIFILLVKYCPFILIIEEILYSWLSYLSIPCDIITYFGNSSLLNIVYLYIGSYVFKFCKYYRIALISIVVVNILVLIDTYYRFSLSDLNMLRLYVIILLLGLLSFIKFKITCNNNRSR